MLSREQLDGASCQMPGCDHAAHEGQDLYMGCRGHLSGRLDVSYRVGSGVLRVACSECGCVIADVMVAAREEGRASGRFAAAAPWLLAACEMVLDDPGLTTSANDVIRSAIMMARSERAGRVS
jgi:hypothetical protein